MSDCGITDCGYAAALWVARVVPPSGAHNSKFIATPLEGTARQGVALCVDHAHEGLDYMIASTRPMPTTEQKPERMT